jgi:hypothetical protein
MSVPNFNRFQEGGGGVDRCLSRLRRIVEREPWHKKKNADKESREEGEMSENWGEN